MHLVLSTTLKHHRETISLKTSPTALRTGMVCDTVSREDLEWAIWILAKQASLDCIVRCWLFSFPLLLLLFLLLLLLLLLPSLQQWCCGRGWGWDGRLMWGEMLLPSASQASTSLQASSAPLLRPAALTTSYRESASFSTRQETQGMFALSELSWGGGVMLVGGMKVVWGVLEVAFLFIGFCPHLILANPDAKRLYDDLLSNYNRLIRWLLFCCYFCWSAVRLFW